MQAGKITNQFVWDRLKYVQEPLLVNDSGWPLGLRLQLLVYLKGAVCSSGEILIPYLNIYNII